MLISVLYDPRSGVQPSSRPDGRESVANIRPAFGSEKGAARGWRSASGGSRGGGVRLAYDAADVRQGLWASAACWGAWVAAIIVAWRREREAA